MGGTYRRVGAQRGGLRHALQPAPVLLFLSVSLLAIALTAFLWPGPGGEELQLSETPSDVEEQRSQQHEEQRRSAAKGLRLLLTSHGRLFWFQPDTNTTTVLHEGQGVHYGVFPGERDAATGALRTLWFVLRPHNWHPTTAEEHLVQVDAETGKEVSRKRLNSRFTHDAVRAGDRVYVCSTESGELLELLYPTMDELNRWRLFTQQQHINSLAPMPLPARASVGLSRSGGGVRGMWVMLHNLGSSTLVRLALPGKGTGAAPKMAGMIEHVGRKAHGVVQWRGWLVLLDSEGGALVKVLPEWQVPVPKQGLPHGGGGAEGGRRSAKATTSSSSSSSSSRHPPHVLYQIPEGHKFLKGLSIVGDVAYFGISVWSQRSSRDDPHADSELGAFDLVTETLLWRTTVPSRGLLNIVAAPHLSESSTYEAVTLPNPQLATDSSTASLTTLTNAAVSGGRGDAASVRLDHGSSSSSKAGAGVEHAASQQGEGGGLEKAGARVNGGSTQSGSSDSGGGSSGGDGSGQSSSHGAAQGSLLRGSGGGSSLGLAGHGVGIGEGGGGGGLVTQRGSQSVSMRSKGGAAGGRGGGGKVAGMVAAGIKDARVEEVTKQLEHMGFHPKVGGHWPSGLPYLDLHSKQHREAWRAGIQLPLTEVDIGPLKEVMQAVPEELWSESYQAEHNAVVAGRDNNMNKFKPGVGAMYLIFSDRTINNTYQFPYYERFKHVVDPIVEQVIGPGSMRKVVRLQFASMPPKSVIKIHRDTGDYAKYAHRIHVPVIMVREDVSFEVCAGLEKRLKDVSIKGEVNDSHVTRKGDCTALPMAEGMVFELNNRLLHRVFNHSPNISRVQLVVDVAEHDKAQHKLLPGAHCKYVKGIITCPPGTSIDL